VKVVESGTPPQLYRCCMAQVGSLTANSSAHNHWDHLYHYASLQLFGMCRIFDSTFGFTAALECPPLGRINNGRIQQYGRVAGRLNTYNSIAKVTCNEGYKISNEGLSQVRCQANQEWTEVPFCIGK